MFRRLSTKWVLAVLASVVVPFVAFAWYVDVHLADRLSNDIVRYYLLSLADDLAEQAEAELDERRLDMELWATDPLVVWSVGPDAQDFVPLLQEGFDRFVHRSRAFDVLLALDAEGDCVVTNRVDVRGDPLPPELVPRRPLLPQPAAPLPAEPAPLPGSITANTTGKTPRQG